MNEINFFIPLRKIPSITAQEQRTGTKKDGSTYRYDPQELKAAKALFRDHLAQHAPPEPFTGPVFLAVTWFYPSGTQHKGGEFKTTKPDTDNLLKAFKDAMTKTGFWKDDAQVCRELNTKIYSDGYTGIAVTVEQLPQTLQEYINAE
jgi:Holliday junction resolvase RusA-like endonuclease